MVFKPTPSQARLKELFSYDEKTGLFTRKVATARKKAGAVVKPMRPSLYHGICVDGKTYPAHRLVWKYMTGQEPDVIDHINGIGRDNRFVNLRSVTAMRNAWNRTRETDNPSGAVGVIPCAGGTLWRARIKTKDRLIFIGPFKTVAEATAARDQLLPLYRGEYHRKEPNQ